MIKVLLLEEIHKVGDIGDVVSVKNGFARNFLIPTGKAMRASPDALKIFEEKKAGLLRQQEERLVAIQELSKKIHRMKLTIQANSSPDGKLYGSIGPGVIADELVRHVPEADGILRKDQIKVPGGNVKTVGDFDIVVSLTTNIQAQVALAISSEGKGGESSLEALPPEADQSPEQTAAVPAEENAEQATQATEQPVAGEKD